jgi:hypothetical protein
MHAGSQRLGERQPGWGSATFLHGVANLSGPECRKLLEHWARSLAQLFAE